MQCNHLWIIVSCSLFVGCGEDEPESRYTPTYTLLPYCIQVKNWDAGWVEFENEVLALTNQERAAGANCHSEGVFGPANPLSLDILLRCAARNHSYDMAERDFFAHTNPDGYDPFDRIDETGYLWVGAGENIAAGSPTPADVISGWMGSDGHCANIMRPGYTELGVGYYMQPVDTYRHYWTQAFGTPQ